MTLPSRPLRTFHRFGSGLSSNMGCERWTTYSRPQAWRGNTCSSRWSQAHRLNGAKVQSWPEKTATGRSALMRVPVTSKPWSLLQ